MTTSVDDFLAHHGVKGMKWGVRKSRAELRALDKASRATDKAKRAKEIQSARDRYNKSARSNYKAAKAEYKEARHVIGKREAKKILNKVKEKNVKDWETGSQYKNGKEVAGAVLLGVGILTASALLSAAVDR